ncbi:transporter substrate-binding domain-containing protein [Kordiimonas sp. SCSIO 12603]|uniref:substrate-binding periplasmic protein n=1 Tax=Kordiimonas sp. SCSIO 12603 TaxID=2829596 RepID=UPI002107CF0E|nr:transporter substrate-binding domain-containing protein [Kordiimonas sp. SCSIO 12603]UTW60132.1 transporter substrate-binding domain-containing protein [Kordiimonas sp. SCSIO 12603]
MFRRLFGFILASVVSVSAFAVERGTISLCSDENFWAPYAFSYDGKSSGTNIEIAKEALKRLGYRVKAQPLSWQRCLSEARKGNYDVIVSAAYRPERAADFYYPLGAEAGEISPYRIIQASYALVTRRGYVWDGIRDNLPHPVGLPKGYSNALELEETGVKAVYAERYSQLFRMLLRGRLNGIIVLEPAARIYLLDEDYRNKLIVQPAIYSSKSYYLIVSKKGKLALEQAKMLWSEVKSIREDNDEMYNIQVKVLKQLRRCLSAAKDCKR